MFTGHDVQKLGADKRLGSESISSGEVPVLAAATDFATRGLGVKDVRFCNLQICNFQHISFHLQVLPWVLTAASIKMGRPHIARREIECAELRLGKDGWPEYYDGKSGWYIGKQA
ncbi:probable alkaline/neutral invertase B [Tanacetum coccineum]